MTYEELHKVISTPRGDARSITSLTPESVNNSPPGTGADWFGPGQPLRPIAPPEVAGRVFDLIPGYNLATRPRAYEPIGFEELRALASSFDPVRLIIERRKDQLTRLDWSIRVKQPDDGSPRKRSASKAISPQLRSVIREVTNFLKRPTPDLTWRAWLRAVLDDCLVIDASSLFFERDDHGNLVALTPIDGATIKRILNDKGQTPRPMRYDGSPFNWLGRAVTAADLDALGFKFVDGLMYPPAFQQVLKGLPAVSMTTPWDLVYSPMNVRTSQVYGYSPVEQIAMTVAIATRRALGQLEYFREGNQPDAFYAMPESWSPDNIQKFQDYFDSLYTGNFANRRKLKFMPGGSTTSYLPTREPPLKSDFDEWLIRIVCAAFSYPPAAFVSLSNRSVAEQHERQAEEEGSEPLKQWLADVINSIVEREFSDEIEFAWTEPDDVDQKTQSEILRGYAESGILTINEARERIGEEPLPEAAADRSMVKTSTGYVPIGQQAKTVEPIDPDDDDDEAQKLSKGIAILMMPPRGWKPVKRFSRGGTTFIPDLGKGGELRVYAEDDVLTLEADGWIKTT